MEYNGYVLKKIISEDRIQIRVKELASELSKKFTKEIPIFIGVLNGSFMFMADLLRFLKIDCEMDFIKLSSYKGQGTTGTIRLLKDISADITNRDVVIVEDIIDHETGEIFMEGGAELDQKSLDELKTAKIKSIEIVNPNKDFHSMMLLNTMIKDPSKNTEEALNIVYQLLRSGEPPNLETAQKFIERIFFNPKKYDLGSW